MPKEMGSSKFRLKQNFRQLEMMITAPILRQPKTDYFLCTVVLTSATDLKYNNSGMNNNPKIMLENNQTILLIKKIHKYK